MDFEIEGEDDYDFQDDWNRNKSKGKSSFFGGDGAGGTRGREDTIYDFDYGDISQNKSKNSGVRASYAPSSSKPEPTRRDDGNVSKSMSAMDKTGEDALSKAQSMLNKYSSKPIKQVKPAKTMFDFDEDDISIGSDNDISTANKKPLATKSKATAAAAKGSSGFVSKRNNFGDSMDSDDIDAVLNDSDEELGDGLDAGPPLFGDEVPPPSFSKKKDKAGSFETASMAKGPSLIPKVSADIRSNIMNDYDDVVDPSPYKMPPKGGYGKQPVNMFSVDDEEDIEEYSEESFDEVEEEAAPRGISRSASGTIGLVPRQQSQVPASKNYDEESKFSDESEEEGNGLEEESVAQESHVSDEHNYSMDYAEDVEDEDEDVKPKIHLMNFADLNSILAEEVVEPKEIPKPAETQSPVALVSKRVEPTLLSEKKKENKPNLAVEEAATVENIPKLAVKAPIAPPELAMTKPPPPAEEPKQSQKPVLGGSYHQIPPHVVAKAEVPIPNERVIAPVIANPPVVEKKGLIATELPPPGVSSSVSFAPSAAPPVHAPQPQAQQMQYQQSPYPQFNSYQQPSEFPQASQQYAAPAPQPPQNYQSQVQYAGPYGGAPPPPPGPYPPPGGYGSPYPYPGYYPYSPNMYWPDPRMSYAMPPPMPPPFPYGGNPYYGSNQNPYTLNQTVPGFNLPQASVRDPGLMRHSLGSIYSQGLFAPTEKPSGMSGAIDYSVLEILKELKLAKDEAAEANRRLADVLMSINSDKISFKDERRIPTRPMPAARSVRASEAAKTNNAKSDVVLDQSDEGFEEYSNDFEDGGASTSNIDRGMELPSKSDAKINVDAKNSSKAPSNRYGNVRMSNESDETPVAPRANLGSDYQGRNTSAPENVWDMLNSANMNLDPMTSTLMTSQMLFRKQLMNLRERIQYTNAMHEFDAKTFAHLKSTGPSGSIDHPMGQK